MNDYAEIARLQVSGSKEEWQQALKNRQQRDFSEIARLRRVNAELVERLRELAETAEHDMKLNQGGDNHDDEPESSGGWWSSKTENAIREARAAIANARRQDARDDEAIALGLIADIAEGSTTANSLPHIARIARRAIELSNRSAAYPRQR